MLANSPLSNWEYYTVRVIYYQKWLMTHTVWVIQYNSYCIIRVYVESINRYFAEEHPHGQEIAIDKGDNQLLENDYRYIIGMETP